MARAASPHPRPPLSPTNQINYLSSVGIPVPDIENMVSISKAILGRTPEELKAVVSWLEGKGLTGAALVDFLEAYPSLLAYSPAANGEYLEKSKARVSLVFGDRGGRRAVGITPWREGTVFGTAPVAPTRPE